MKKEDNKPTKKLARGKFLTVLGSALLIPLLSKAQVLGTDEDGTNKEDADYQILLKPDGSAVKVKRQNLNKSQTIKTKLSNPALKSWLKK